MQGAVTRRVLITAEQLGAEAVREELFAALAVYGQIELVSCVEDTNYSTCTVTVQFQRLSSAERLQGDAMSSGRPWCVQFDPPVSHVGDTLLLSSPKPFDQRHLASLIDSHVAAAQAEGKVSPGVTVEEKLLHVPGVSRGVRAASLLGNPLERDANPAMKVWADYAAAAALVQKYAIGSYILLLHFPSPHDASCFLALHQSTLATSHNVYCQYIAPEGSPLELACAKLLKRRTLDEVLGGDAVMVGGVLRGYVVHVTSNAVCSVDAGVTITSAESSQVSILLETQTNFLKVSVGDEVDVRVTQIVAKSVPSVVCASLMKVVGESHAQKRAIRTSLPTTASRSMRTANLTHTRTPFAGSVARGGGLSSTGTSKPSAPSPLTNVLCRLRAGAPPRPGPSSASHAASGVKPSTSGGAAKALAGKLFKCIQEKKASGELAASVKGPLSRSRAVGGGAIAERLCQYPPGLHLYSRLLVRIERIGHDGLYTRCLPRDSSDTLTEGWPVFVPSSYVPTEEDLEWRNFAVVGERMTVALLYTVTVGESAATRRCIASKLTADMRRVAVYSSMDAAGGENGPGKTSYENGADSEESFDLPVEGTALSGVCTHVLTSEHGGIADTVHFPAYIVQPTAQASPCAFRLLVVLPVKYCAGSQPCSVATAMELAIAEVVHDIHRGHYAVAMRMADYKERLSLLEQGELLRKEAAEHAVKRKLAAALGGDVLGLEETAHEETTAEDESALKVARVE